MVDFDQLLHDSDEAQLERRIMKVALEQTGAKHGAILLWDEEAKGLRIAFHMVDGLIVTLPDEVLPIKEDKQINGIAAYVYLKNEPYVCAHGPTDPYYARYYFSVTSIAAVPIQYQGRPIGVLSVSSRKRDRFGDRTIDILKDLAGSSAKFLRRAQLYRESKKGKGRPFLIKGLSPEWLEVEKRIERVARTKAPVLITGESGTGKELTAHAIHFNSARNDKPFVTVNCAAIPEQLLESVLFGHVKGAFTGATSDKKGEFSKADGGTLFLDELGELPVPLQAKVLRAVEDGEVMPVGSNERAANVDVRFVCATNRDLPAMMKRGAFRDDLYYRLSVMTMHLPPLRSYKHNNLQVIALVFLKQASKTHGKQVRGFSPKALATLLAYNYPGNVRELKNAVEHGVIMAESDTITQADLPGTLQTSDSSADVVEDSLPAQKTLAELREEWLAPIETRYLTELLAACQGNVAQAAARSGVNVVTMYRLLKKRGMARTRTSR